ncbi:hypothetical protein [Halovivax cerinus]|uniref:Lipoprotein n=1 Tax=Halovivax cerinus TaxID=1487865 RepID=A0ABD5NMW4_9EURY|nr:hypothetical protein [Halovivax cerinus]
MDRRSVLVGSGTAFTLALAGCMGGDGTDEDEPQNDVQTGGETNEDDETTDGDDLPGIDADDLDRLTEYVSVREVSIEDRTLTIVADLTVDSKKKGMTDLGDGLKKGLSDVHELKKKIDWVKIVLYDTGETVFTTKVNVDWLVKLVDEEIDMEEFRSYLEDDGDD